ncbi:MAG: ABC transporter permease [Euryarchaeota archaeon]|nr:ABC transporter permease [Euryarchaeota archaeon]
MLDYLRYSMRTLMHHKLRSFLTLLGVIIGIMAIVSMVSVGSGMEESLRKQLEVLGSDKIVVSPRIAYGTTSVILTDDDARALESIPGVAFVSPIYTVSSDVEFSGETKVMQVMGVDPEKAEETFGRGAGSYKLLSGRWLQKGDRYKLVLGYSVARDTFTRDLWVGSRVNLHGKEFEVVGVFAKAGDRSRDYSIYTSIDVLRELFNAGNRVTFIVIRVEKGADIDKVRMQVEDKLKRRKGTDKGYYVVTQKEIMEEVGEAYNVVKVVFGGLASVSLIVGAIGIANTMIMNVTERRREIGVLLASGASRAQVMRIFLMDAALLGVAGGAAGLALGYGVSLLINVAAERYLGEGVLVTSVTPELAVFSLLFALLVGVVSGMYPAYRASRLEPVEALRA